MPEELSVESLRARIGQPAATTDWRRVPQSQIDGFADATGDTQWIHVDAARAAASPFGSTIAHGFLTLALLVPFLQDAVSVAGTDMAINYGLNKVRFVTPVPAGGRLRARFAPAAVDDLPGAVQVTWAVTVELEGHPRPACVAEWVVRYRLA